MNGTQFQELRDLILRESGRLDGKIENINESLKKQVHEIRLDYLNVTNAVNQIGLDVETLKADVSGLKADVKEIKNHLLNGKGQS